MNAPTKRELMCCTEKRKTLVNERIREFCRKRGKIGSQIIESIYEWFWRSLRKKYRNMSSNKLTCLTEIILTYGNTFHNIGYIDRYVKKKFV